MGLVSSIYRMAPPEAVATREEAERRRSLWVRRLCRQLGREVVLVRLRAYPVRREDEILRAWLVLEAEGVPDGHLTGTI